MNIDTPQGEGATAFLAELVAPRTLPESETLHASVQSSVQQLNTRFTADLLAPMNLATDGWSLRAVLRDAGAAFDIAARLHLTHWPMRFRIATMQGGPGTSTMSLDHPIFREARRQLDRLAELDADFSFQDPARPESSQLVSELGSVHLWLLRLMKARTVDALKHYYDRHPTQPAPLQAEVAKRLGLATRQAVSDALRRAHYPRLTRIEETIRRCLSESDEA